MRNAERYTFSLLPVTYRLDQLTQSKLLIWLAVTGNQTHKPWIAKASALPIEVPGHAKVHPLTA